jgi:hypothetical protein
MREKDPLLSFREVADLRLNEKTSNALLRKGIDFIGELYDLSISELLQILYIGRKGLNEIEHALQVQYGLTFRGERSVPKIMVWPAKHSDFYMVQVAPVRKRRDAERAELQKLDEHRKINRRERRKAQSLPFNLT